MDHRRTEEMFAVVAPGLEPVCAAELEALGLGSPTIEPGGIAFAGKLRELYLANLHLRTANRILVRFAAFRCRAFPDLFRQATKLPWGRFVRPEQAVRFRVTCRGSRLVHSDRVAATLADAVDRALGRSGVVEDAEPQLVVVRVIDDRVELSLDSSGELLHRRGYRQSVTVAPLRETLAAGVLQLFGWDGSVPLADPMCGSGSFLVEGALLAGRRAPGLERSFAFMRWPGWREGLWALLAREARRAEVPVAVPITGGDASAVALAAARDNARRCGVEEQIVFEQVALADRPVRPGPGLVVCNPPYGKRLARGADLRGLYRDLGTQLKRAYPGWRIALICPPGELPWATGLPLEELALLDNGGLTVGLYATRG